MRCDWDAVGRDFLMAQAARGDRMAAELLRGLLVADQRPDLDNRTGVGSVLRVAIGVCTAMRPRMLAHCLDAIGAQILPAWIEAEVIIVDNESEPRRRRLVQNFSARCPFPVHYIHEPRRGISQARNAVIERSRRLGAQWIAFTDDDCWVSPTWLVRLVEAAIRYKADVVYGRREFVLPTSSPCWPALRAGRYVEGQSLSYASTHNVLFASWLIRHDNLPGLHFDERLAHGEDTDFFYRATQLGARIVYSHEPVVFETVSLDRTTLNYQVRRAYHYGASRGNFHRRYQGVLGALPWAAARCAFHTPIAVVRLLTAALVWGFSESTYKALVIKGSVRLAGAAGAVAGLLGFAGNPYQTIDGY